MNRKDVQKIIDILFEVAMMGYGKNSNHCHFKTREEYAKWISKQLNESGFEGESVGSNWHYLKDR